MSHVIAFREESENASLSGFNMLSIRDIKHVSISVTLYFKVTWLHCTE